MFLEIIGTCIFLSIGYIYYDRRLRFPGYPPGPFRWPIVGNLSIFMTKYPEVRIEEIQKSLNTSVMTIVLGSRKIVVCNSLEGLRSMQSSLCAGRFESIFTENSYFNIKYDQGPNWYERRKMTQAFLLGHKSILSHDDSLVTNVHNLVEDIRAEVKTGKSFDPSYMIFKALVASVSELVCNGSMNDDAMKQFFKNAYAYLHFVFLWRRFCVAIPFKLLRRFLFQWILNAATEINNTLYPMVKSSMKSFDYKSPPNSYIDLVLQKKKKLSLMGKTPEYLDELNILDWASKMIVGGGIGAKITLQRSFFMLTSTPTWQQKLYKEIISARHITPLPSEIRDPERFPALLAFIKEVMRTNSPGLQTPRRLISDMEICYIFGEEQVALILFYLLREFEFVSIDKWILQGCKIVREMRITMKERQAKTVG
eukprot:451747_1